MSVTPAINRRVFFSMHFSNKVEIILSTINGINFEELKKQIDEKASIIKVNNLITINTNTMLIYLKGHRISSTQWFTLHNTQENNMIELDCDKKQYMNVYIICIICI